MKRLIKASLRRFGFDLVRHRTLITPELDAITDLSAEEQKIVATVKPFTMTGVHRIAALLNATAYIVANDIRGDIAECGVWRGGSMMAAALALLARKDISRSLYLYDTFEGMSAPAVHDRSWDGTPAADLLAREPHGTGIWCYATQEDVRANMLSTGYPKDKIHLIKGKVEETIPKTLPARLALLRLDTDWYESTKHELNHLFPRLDPKGVLIIDDYGCWQGAKKAVDEFFQEQNRAPYLHRIDETGRIVVGTGI